MSSTAEGLYLLESSIERQRYTNPRKIAIFASVRKYSVMNNNDNNNPQPLNIEIRDEVATGKYSNLAVISHSHSEFIIDFAQMMPGRGKPNVCSRIIMAPEHAKRLLNALSDNVAKYEHQFGKIDDGQTPRGTLNVADLLNGSKS